MARPSVKCKCDICNRAMDISTKDSHLAGKGHTEEVKRSAEKDDTTQVITHPFESSPPLGEKNVLSRAIRTTPKMFIIPNGGHKNDSVLITSELTNHVLEAMEKGINSRISSADDIYRTILDARRKVDRLDAEIAPLLALRTDIVAQIVIMHRQIAPSIMANFPNETLIKIFQFCIGDSIVLTSGSRRAAPLAELAEVCKRWRLIIMGTPGLWNSIRLNFKKFTDFDCLINSGRKCLERAGTVLPISIKGSGVRYSKNGSITVQPVKALVIPFASRLKHLKLSFPYHWLRPLFDMPPGSMPIIESVDITFMYGIPTFIEDMIIFHHSPNLRHFRFRIYRLTRFDIVHNISSPHLGLQFPWPRFQWHQLTYLSFSGIRLPSEIWHAVLRKSVNLVSCVLSLFDSDDPFVPCNTILYALESLTINTQECMSVDNFIKPCIFPALKYLTLQGLSESPWSQQNFSHFVSRSRCYLTSLIISLPMPARTIMEILESVPYLTKLNLSNGCNMSSSILSQMTRWALVPKLRNLRCTLDPGLLKEFIDMYEYRWINAGTSRKYSRIHSAWITCRTGGRLVDQAKEQLNDLGEIGESITLRVWGTSWR